MRTTYLSLAVLLPLFLAASACSGPNSEAKATDTALAAATNRSTVDGVLDDWHQAAAEADFERYFAHFHSDTSIFMGTDATERWTVAEFKPWAKPYFDRGRAWSFTPHNRFVYFSPEGSMAWFDEELQTPNLGPSRGSGVLRHTPEGWKIEHYNLTIPIPNELVGRVVSQIDSTLKAQP
jgi:hypothetical protein